MHVQCSICPLMYTRTPTLKSNVCAFAGSEQMKTERSFTVKIAELTTTDYVIIPSDFKSNTMASTY